MTLAAFTSPALINASLRGGDAAGVITELTQLLYAEGVVTDSLAFCQAALNREFMAPTNVGVIAFPHARSPVVSRLAVTIGRSRRSVTWGRNGGEAQLIFLIAVPPSCAAMYFNLLTMLSGLFRNTRARAQLLAAENAREMFEVVKQLHDRTVGV